MLPEECSLQSPLVAKFANNSCYFENYQRNMKKGSIKKSTPSQILPSQISLKQCRACKNNYNKSGKVSFRYQIKGYNTSLSVRSAALKGRCTFTNKTNACKHATGRKHNPSCYFNFKHWKRDVRSTFLTVSIVSIFRI